MSSQSANGGDEWIFVDRKTGEPHEGLSEAVVDEWESIFRSEGRPYEVIEPDNTRRLYDGE